MAKYVLFGGPFVNVDGPHHGETFGEVLDFSDEDANTLIRGGAAIIPQDEFNKLFAKADVLRYPNALAQQEAPEAFKASLTAASAVFAKLREPEPAVTIGPAVESSGASSAEPLAE